MKPKKLEVLALAAVFLLTQGISYPEIALAGGETVYNQTTGTFTATQTYDPNVSSTDSSSSVESTSSTDFLSSTSITSEPTSTAEDIPQGTDVVRDEPYKNDWEAGENTQFGFTAEGNVTISFPQGSLNPRIEGSASNDLSTPIDLSNVDQIYIRFRGEAPGHFQLLINDGASNIIRKEIDVTGNNVWQEVVIGAPALPSSGNQATQLVLRTYHYDPALELEISNLVFVPLEIPSEAIQTPSSANFYYTIDSEESSPHYRQLTLYHVTDSGIESQILVPFSQRTFVFEPVDVSPDGANVVYWEGPSMYTVHVQRVANPAEHFSHRTYANTLSQISFTEYHEVVLKTHIGYDTVTVDLQTLNYFDFKITQEVVTSPNGRYEVKDERPFGRLLIRDSQRQQTMQLVLQVTELPVVSFNITDQGIYYVTGHDRIPTIRYVSFADAFASGGDTVPQSAKQTVNLSVTPRDRDAIQFIPGDNSALVTDSKGRTYFVNLKTGSVLNTKVTRQVLDFYDGNLPAGSKISWTRNIDSLGNTIWTVSVIVNPNAGSGEVHTQQFIFLRYFGADPIRLSQVVETDSNQKTIRRSAFEYAADGSLKRINRYDSKGRLISKIEIVVINGKSVYQLTLSRKKKKKIVGEVGVTPLYQVFQNSLVRGG